MWKKINIRIILGLLMLCNCDISWGAWVQLGSSLNLNSSQNGQRPKIAIANNRPIVAWCENNTGYSKSHLYVKQWTGSNWIQLGSALNDDPAQNASFPSLACSNNRQYIFWIEEPAPNKLYYSSWGGTNWLPGVSININSANSADRPDSTISGDIPYVTWQEGASYNIFAKYYNGTAMQQIGSSRANTITAAYYPRIELRNATPLMAFIESDELVVKEFVAGNWQYVYGQLNANPESGIGQGGITSSGTATFVTWFEASAGVYQVYVKSDTGSNWGLVGGSLNSNTTCAAYNPKVARVGNTPYVAWYENPAAISQVYVKYYDGISFSWQSLGGSLNVNPSYDAQPPDIAVTSQGIYVVWAEDNGVADQVYVKYWAFPTAVPSPTPTSIRTPTPTPTPPVVAGTLGMNSVLAYPNPASGQVTFVFRADSGSGLAVARLYNTHYRLAAEARGTATDGQGSIALEVSGLAQGVYFYQVMANGKKLPMGKVVVAR